MMILRKGGVAAMTTEWQETLVEKQVTYTLELSGKIILNLSIPVKIIVIKSIDTGYSIT